MEKGEGLRVVGKEGRGRVKGGKRGRVKGGGKRGRVKGGGKRGKG